MPPLSIIIPAYNYAAYLAEAVCSALAQDYGGEIEVLVVDDGSTDETPSVASSFGGKIRYQRKQNAGLSAARNTGMELASHDLVVFLDADDRLEPDAARRLVEVWTSRASPPVVVGAMGRMIDASGQWLNEEPPGSGDVREFSAEDFVLRNRFAPIVLAMRRHLMDLGGFDPALKASEDRDMWIRAATRGDVVMLDACLYRKRDHGTNMSRHAARQTEAILQVLAKARRNPAVVLPAHTWREAEAICLFQSARMHVAAGDCRTAVLQCARSIRLVPGLRCVHEVGYFPLFRIRFLILQLASLLRIRRGSNPDPGAPKSRSKEVTTPMA